MRRDRPTRPMFIGGQWLQAQDGAAIPVVSHVDGQVFDAISRGKAHEVDLAVKAARRALDGTWGPPHGHGARPADAAHRRQGARS
jgi:acyl-CoA reductase-like NAD-dependent aldehyde dehydrogenase